MVQADTPAEALSSIALQRCQQDMKEGEIAAVRFSAEYDLPAGQGRYAGWLREQVTGAEIWDADGAVTVLYSQHYRALVGLAAFLVRDVAAAEELVQDSFVAVHSAWPKLHGRDQAVSFLRRSVIQGSRHRGMT